MFTLHLVFSFMNIYNLNIIMRTFYCFKTSMFNCWRKLCLNISSRLSFKSTVTLIFFWKFIVQLLNKQSKMMRKRIHCQFSSYLNSDCIITNVFKYIWLILYFKVYFHSLIHPFITCSIPKVMKYIKKLILL